MNYLTPHTQEWFKALEAYKPHQAAITKEIVKITGSEAVCSICGAAPTTDYKVDGAKYTESLGASIRLCNDCLEMSTNAGQSFSPL